MNNRKLKVAVCSALFIRSGSAFAAAEDDPLLFMFKADQLEVRDADEGTVTGWEAFAWIGKDLNKFWFKTEGERTEDETEGSEYQFLYSRAIDPNWMSQLGSIARL